ncbi:MAG: hypothetical protein JXA99_14165 [Candidatus Lokiarchaeota archaeon]|nr:hypothetical protein [Candidatus Lokiarchaeota archaeon]
MSGTLPIAYTEDFKNNFKIYVKKNKRKNVIYELNHITLIDVKRITNLKGPLKFFKRITYGSSRILFLYCRQCFEEFAKYFNCEQCDTNSLDQLIILDIHPRGTAYRKTIKPGFKFSTNWR